MQPFNPASRSPLHFKGAAEAKLIFYTRHNMFRLQPVINGMTSTLGYSDGFMVNLDQQYPANSYKTA
jgi:hypothetical protein